MSGRRIRLLLSRGGDGRRPANPRQLHAGLLDQLIVLPQRERIEAHIGAAALARITSCHGLAFLDGADYEAVVAAGHAELDEQTFLRVLRRQTNTFRETPLIATTVRALLRLVGSSAHGIFRHLPRLRDATVRGFGTLAYERVGDKEARLTLHGYPTAYTNDANVVVMRATFLGVLDLTGDEGEAVLTSRDAARGDMDFTVRWR